VLNLHALLSDNLLANADASGRLRQGLVGITNSVFSPLNLPQELERLFDVLLAKATAIEDPFEQAFFGMVHIPYLQPFEDVNKRVSRLAANIPLVQRNLCPLSFVEVPQRAYVEGTLGVYELGRVDLLRDVFVWAYERSCHRYTAIRETLAEPDPTRLVYRAQIRAGVAAIVRGALARDEDAVIAWARAEGVDEASTDVVAAMILGDVERLHIGNIARYGLRPSELEAWLSRRR